MSKPQGAFPDHIDVSLLDRYDPADLFPQAAVYVIHLDEPVRHAKHYVGHCRNDVRGRLLTHARCLDCAARLLIHVGSQGLGWTLTALHTFGAGHDAMKEARAFEALLKRRKSNAKCPLCIGEVRRRSRERMKRIRTRIKRK